MSLFKKILVPGGAGYVGSALVPKLLDAGYGVRVLDSYLYDPDALKDCRGRAGFEELRGDVRNLKAVQEAVTGCDAVIHLACISNDPSFELDPELSLSINYDSFRPFVKACKSARVRRFIFASSSSVYGVSEAAEVTEEHPHVPITDYNRYKSLCESILKEETTDDFVTVAIRPATLCGWAPRLRLDLTVNILTSQAYCNGRITVFGGSQMRPHLHVNDMVDLYLKVLEAPEDVIQGQAFNAACTNLRVSEIAELVKRTVQPRLATKKEIQIVTTPSDDPRSYHISAEKLRTRLGFVPSRTVEDAVNDLIDAFEAGKIPDALTSARYYNVKTLKASKIR